MGTPRRFGTAGSAVLALAMALAACSDSDGSLLPLGSMAPTPPASDAARSEPAGQATERNGASGDSTSAPAEPTAPTTTLLRTPIAIEDTLVDPTTAWPAAAAGGAAPGPTRVSFVDGTDNALLPAIYQPVLPTVPGATIATNGGGVVVRVSGYEFPDDAAADAWRASWEPYGVHEAADLPGGVHVERQPLAAANEWNGFMVDALYSRDPATLWQRTATLMRVYGRRAYTVSVRWFGDSAAGVPDVSPDVVALAGAQDSFLMGQRIGPETPGTGRDGGIGRLALTERAAPWASLLAQPDIAVDAGIQVLFADSPDLIPAGAAGASAIAARVACGERGCPVFSVVTRFPDAAAASAAAAAWSQPEAMLGPLDDVAFGSATGPPPGATGPSLADVAPVDTSAVPGSGALTATLSDGVASYQVGAGWFARGDTVYGAFTVYPSTARNAETVVAVLSDHAARLSALGIT